VEELDPVASLLAAIDRTAVPPRMRRELLAGIYLRRGFLESAAEEWMEACHEDGPDADALVGLAQVAWAQGLHDDALVFAREAEALDPGHPVAAGLAERLLGALPALASSPV
jgi:hypothetical protein